MRKSLTALFAVAGLMAVPTVAPASDGGAAAGAVTGGVIGGVVGGPVGAAIGAGAGAIVGGTTTGPNPPPAVVAEPPATGTVVIDRPATMREQTCVQDAYGNRTCREVVR